MSELLNQSMAQKYFQPPAGNTEKYINLKPVKILNGLVSSYHCLKDYHIQEFGKGFKAAEFILQHIVVNKLNGSFQKKNDFWHKTVAVKLECDLLSAPTSLSFLELKPTTVENIHPKFAAAEGPNRIADIYKYSERYLKGEDITPPLYATGDVLNAVGANIDPKMIFMMDGARRIAAAAITHLPRITIYLLMLESEFAQQLEEKHLLGLANQIKKIQWFDSYQTIPLVGLQGTRSLKRFELIDMTILQEHTVMDFGCNLGQSCIKAVQAGAKKVIGIEGMKDTCRVACEIGNTIGFPSLHYLNVDFNDVHFNNQIDEYYPHKVDYSFFLSVYRTKELTQRESLFHYIINKTKKGIFFEGHAHSKIDTIEYYDWLFDCFKLKYEFLGYSEKNLRPLFFCPIESHSSCHQLTPRIIETIAKEQRGISDKKKYTVSAIVSTYESEKFIEGKIQDLLNQTIGEQLEIIIIDSHSPENEKAIVAKYAEKHQNIKYIRTQDRESIYKAWNRGIKAAHGKYITNAKIDDRLRPDALEILLNVLDRNPDIALAYGDFFITNYENQDFYNHVCCGYSIKPDYVPSIMLSGYHMDPQLMWRKSVHDEIGYFDESLESAGDYELWCRLSIHYSMKHINKFLGLYYHNPIGIVNSEQNKNNRETRLVKEKYKDKLPPSSGKKPTGYYFKEGVSILSYVNVCVVTFNRRDFTKQAIESILKNTRYPHVITVVDNNSQDGTKEYLTEIKREGIIKNLILLDENIGVAKASNLAWQEEPGAAYYLKYDNDIVIQKPDWLMNMVKVVDRIPELGAIGYNFEPSSYPGQEINGHKIRIKRDANIGGACYLIPKRVEEKLGYWCEDYGLYGEEDGDYSLRLRLAGYYNAYMEDENIGIHLPGDRAALIDSVSKRGICYQELEEEYEYRTWKDSRRLDLQKPGGILERNVFAYQNGIRSLYVPRGEFQGKLGPNVQVFKHNGFISFLPVSEKIGQSEMEYISRWFAENNLKDCKTEKYTENGIGVLRVIHALSGNGLDIKSTYSAESPFLLSTAADIKNQSLSNRIKNNNPSNAVTVSIILPVFNQWEYTRNCIEALYHVTDKNCGFEVIVVDNASTDNTKLFLNEAKEKYPGLSFIHNQCNLGFAKACNKGARHSRGYYLVVLNNDTLPQPGWLDEMIKTAEKDPLVGLVGSRLLYPDGTIQHAGVYFNENAIPYHAFRSAASDHPAVLVTRETPAVTGACMLMPKQLFKQIGGFNEDYHMYVEDVDLCLRTWDAGFKVVYCAESILTHFESASITDVNRRDVQVRAAWNHLHKSWRNKWPTILQGLTPQDTIRRHNLDLITVSYNNSPKEIKVLWYAPIYDPSGYADEARNFILHLQKQNIMPAVREIGRRSNVFRNGIEEQTRIRLDEAISKNTGRGFISIVQFPAYAFQRVPHARYNIGRTTFETDGLPADWVQKCNLMDEIWVPSEFNMQTFKAAGVTSKLFKVPEGVDTERFRPGLDVLEIPGTRGVVFLSIFEWIYRKGWDVLLRSWAMAFKPDDDVSLVLRTYPINSAEGIGVKKEIELRIDRFLEVELRKSREEVAPIVVLPDQLREQDVPRLYAAADAYVLPSRGEGWGRTQMEAMACGLPVLSTRWGGTLEFMNDHNSLLIDINGLVEIDERTEIPFYRGQKWAEPSAENLREMMRKIVEKPAEVQEIGRRARLDIERYWQWDRIAYIAAKRLRAICADLKNCTVKKSCSNEPLKVIWEGSQFVHHSLALVNRELCIELTGRQEIELSIIPYEPHEFGPEEDPERFELIDKRLRKPLPNAADFHVRHQWPPNFTPPPDGHWIVIQPWEYGALPKDWVEPMRSQVDELWVYSNYVREVYINSGIPASKVFVVPLGVDYENFHSQAKPKTLNTEKTFKFLFVGGTIPRKGIDVLLDAYTSAFNCADDVCLVIKDMGVGTFYSGQSATERIMAIQKDVDAPEILYYKEYLTAKHMAGLYTACDCLVHPYRGEGFGLPVAEAMACGLPVLVTRGGACDDFCNDNNSLLIESQRRPIVMNDSELCDTGWVLEPDQHDLIRRLRFIYENKDEGRKIGAVAARQIRELVSWEKSANLVVQRIKELKNKPIIRLHLNDCQKSNDNNNSDLLLYTSIQEQISNGDFKVAIAKLEELTGNMPDLAIAYNDLGVLYHCQGKNTLALTRYRRAVCLEPGNTNFRKNLADILAVEFGEYEEALQHYVTVLASAPKDVEALLATGHICARLERYDDAADFYERVLEIEPNNSDAQNWLAKMRERSPAKCMEGDLNFHYLALLSEIDQQDLAGAIKKIENFIEMYPKHGQAHNDLGVLYYKNESKTKVLACYLKAVDLEPENVTFRKNLADFLYVEEGRVEEALENYIAVLRIKPDDVETLLITGHICTAIERFEDAMSFYHKVLDIDSQNLDARQNMEALKKRQVLMLHQEARGEKKPDDDAEISQVESHASVDEVPIVQAGVVENLIKKADLLFQKERIDQAIDTLLKAIAVNPLDGRNYIELAGQLVNHGRHENALEVLSEMPVNQPEALAKQNLLLQGYGQEGMGNYTAARKCCAIVLECEPENAKALNLNGILAYRNGDKATAEKHFKRAIELTSEYGEPHTNLGALVWETSEPKMALEHYERGFSISPTDIDVANAYHEAVSATGEYKRAEKAARSALKKYPQCRKVLYLLIDTLIRQEKNEEALKELEIALSTFGIDEGLLDTALGFRERVGKIKKTGSAKKPGVSLCMIVKDEEANLARCLASVKPIVDEMIVVDTGSTDRTKDIAEFFGALVYKFEWGGDFAEARNFSLSKAKGDWILILDADEIISPQDYKRFRKLTAKKPSGLTAYSIITRNYCNMANTIGWIPNTGQYISEEAGLGWLSSEKVRLFSNNSEIKFEGAVHELVEPVLKRQAIEMKKCPIPVHHYGRLNTGKLARKNQTYYEIGHNKLLRNGGDIGAVRELAVQATVLEKNSEAIELWQKFLSMGPGELEVSDAYVNMVSAYIRLQDYDNALRLAQKTVLISPQMKEAQYNLGIAELFSGNVDVAFKTFKKLTQRYPDFPPAQFLLAASNYCRKDATDMNGTIKKLKQSAFGPALTYSVTELAEGLMTANQYELAHKLLQNAIEDEIISKSILGLYTDCLEKIKESNKVSDMIFEKGNTLSESISECN